MICLPYGAPGMTSPFTRLLHLGNVVVDVVLDVPALPEPGGDVLATRSQTAAGGGFNVMAAAARLLGWLGRLGEHVVVFDPGPLAGTLPGHVLDPVLARADWLTCNARESV